MTKKLGRAPGLSAPLTLLVSVLTSCQHSGSVQSRAAEGSSATTTLPPTSAPDSDPGTETEAHAIDPAADLLEAAETVRLTETQRQIVWGLRNRVAKYGQGASAALQGLREDVASQVRAGTIEPAALRTGETGAVGAVTIHVDEGAEAMNALYVALDSSQRAAIVAAVRAMTPDRAAAPRAGTCRDRAGRIAARLGLDSAQRRLASSLLQGLPPTPSIRDERRRELDAVIDAFARNNFDGWTIVPAPLVPPAESLRQNVDCEVGFFARLLAILRPDQRERLASVLEARPTDSSLSDDDSGL